MSRSLTKAAHYVQLLDEARCAGNWDAVPEFVRKIRKHAPDRVCLTLTAETECAIEKATRNAPLAGSGVATAVAADLDTSTQVPKLLTVIDGETVRLQERYQAKVCVGWLHWVVGEYELAFGRLPHGAEAEASAGSAGETVTDWTRVCVLKSAYLRANCLARRGKRREALAVFEEGLPCVTTAAHGDALARKQLRYWSELFLTEFCMLFSHTLELGEVALTDANCLVSLRAWARYWEGVSGASASGGHGFRGSVPRRRIWFEYYAVLSALVEDDLPYPPTAGTPAAGTGTDASRDQLRIELKKVEAVYETLLLAETAFPRADEERAEVEAFVRLVAQNWAILKSRGWSAADVGAGGKEAMSRGVLDVLYRAATRTYHSTAILRHLFAVHLTVAEFDLALRAHTSYLGLVRKGKARVRKTGHAEPGLDDDATVLETVAQGIVALCRYGGSGRGAQAHTLATELKTCLEGLADSGRVTEAEENGNGTAHGIGTTSETGCLVAGQDIPPRVLAAAWQAVGIAQAQWARTTVDATARPWLQADAVRSLRRSLAPPGSGTAARLRSVFALGLLLAEQRDLGAAIDLVRGALLAHAADDPKDMGNDRLQGAFWRERAMVPLWHLLALLLSARQEYGMAARACEGALEQFRDPAVLFGSGGGGGFRSEHLAARDPSATDTPATRGLVDDMDDWEKEALLGVKMTQLALLELLESPRVAVNASTELLGLFTRLFGPVSFSASNGGGSGGGGRSPVDIPRSSAGTLRSIKGSLFGRPGGRPLTRQAPTNTVTRSQSGKRHSSLRKRETSVTRRPASSSAVSMHPNDGTSGTGNGPLADGDALFTPVDDGRDGSEVFQFSTGRRRLSASAGGPPVSLGRQAAQVESLLAARSATQASLVDLAPAAASLMPPIHFSKDDEGRRRAALLVDVWLLVAGFYRRAGMLEDAREAVAEAQKLVQTLGDDGSARDGWAAKKSVDELWADVWTETGNQSLCTSAYVARVHYEAALTHFPDHPGAIIGLSNILLDMYSQKLLPLPAIPRLALADGTMFPPRPSTAEAHAADSTELPVQPLGLVVQPFAAAEPPATNGATPVDDALVPPYKATALSLVDRLAARDRAFALLSGLTSLGTAWNNAEAWFALAHAHEESGQPDKAKEALWWCVELEEAAAVRPWTCVTTGGYVL